MISTNPSRWVGRGLGYIHGRTGKLGQAKERQGFRAGATAVARARDVNSGPDQPGPRHLKAQQGPCRSLKTAAVRPAVQANKSWSVLALLLQKGTTTKSAAEDSSGKVL